ncbi:MAG: hypothetical protein AAF755_00160 [Pseudomonadota bacterium]
MILPAFTTPADIAAHYGASQRAVEDKVRELGCYAKIGAKVVLYDHHFEAFLEATECHLKSTGAAKSGTTGALSPGGDYEALQAQRTKKSGSVSRTKSRNVPGRVISMDRGQR